MSAVGPNATVDTDLANLRVGVYGAIGGAQSKYPEKGLNSKQDDLEKNGKLYKENFHHKNHRKLERWSIEIT